MSSEVMVEFALTVLQVESSSGGAINNGDTVTFDARTGTAKSSAYFGLVDVVGTETGGWSGQAFDSEQFAAQIASRRPATRHVVFFIHGFNSQPGDVFSAYRQMAASLDDASVLLVPVVWACSDLGVFGARYLDDKRISSKTGKALGRAFSHYFLSHERALKFRVHLLAHSMGNRVLDATIASFVAGLDAAAMPKIVGSIFSVAADVSHDIFAEDTGRYWPQSAHNICVYHAANDKALELSSVVNLGKRLGQNGPDPRPHDVQVFDCSAFNMQADPKYGHSYHYSLEIVEHVRQSILSGLVPSILPLI